MFLPSQHRTGYRKSPQNLFQEGRHEHVADDPFSSIMQMPAVCFCHFFRALATSVSCGLELNHMSSLACHTSVTGTEFPELFHWVYLGRSQCSTGASWKAQCPWNGDVCLPFVTIKFEWSVVDFKYICWGGDLSLCPRVFIYYTERKKKRRCFCCMWLCTQHLGSKSDSGTSGDTVEMQPLNLAGVLLLA